MSIELNDQQGEFMKRMVSAVLSAVVLLLAPLVVVGRAHALSNVQFTLVSDPSTAVVDMSHITNPPLPGQPLTVNEQLKDANGQPAGSATINCIVLAFSLVPEPALLLDCQAHFNLTNGTIEGHAAFWTFQHDYPAAVLSGTGAYSGALGTVRVLDRAPGDETYMFNLILP